MPEEEVEQEAAVSDAWISDKLAILLIGLAAILGIALMCVIIAVIAIARR